MSLKKSGLPLRTVRVGGYCLDSGSGLFAKNCLSGYIKIDMYTYIYIYIYIHICTHHSIIGPICEFARHLPHTLNSGHVWCARTKSDRRDRLD